MYNKMQIKQKLKDFWKYLNTSPGTYQKLISSEPQTYGFTSLRGVGTEDVYKEVPYKTPLQKIIDKTIVSMALGLIVFGIGTCTYNMHKEAELKRERIERMIPHHYSLEHMLGEKQTLLGEIEWMTHANRRMGLNLYDIDIKRCEQKIKKINKQVEDFKEKIKIKVEKGYLTPNNEEWDYYKEIYWNESWWPKDTNSLN
jgi:chaperonin cofactor prefoldin